jgi:hypothetical protein
MLAVVKALMMVMNWINKRQFEKKVTKFMKKEKAHAEELQESEASFGNSISGDNLYLRKTFNIQDEENNVSDTFL